MNLTIDAFLTMPMQRILALVVSELSQMRDAGARQTKEELEARWRFGLLPDADRADALMWLLGNRGPGWEWDNRRSPRNDRQASR